jgi:putative membrane protein
MMRLIAAFAVNTVAVAVAIIVLPQITFDGDGIQLLGLGLIVGLINTFLAPILRILSFPINLVTLGLFTFVVNGGLLLLAGWIAGELDIPLSIGGFPPDLTADAVLAAFLGALLISAVSTTLGLLGKISPV